MASIDKNLELFPNPATSFINLKFNSKLPQEFVVSIYDVLGRCIMSTREDGQNGLIFRSFDIQSLASGVYYMKIDSPDHHLVKAFIKNK
jgi:hypothetical protein